MWAMPTKNLVISQIYIITPASSLWEKFLHYLDAMNHAQTSHFEFSFYSNSHGFVSVGLEMILKAIGLVEV